MWNSLTKLSFTPAEFAIRAVFVFLFVLILLRVAGKRQLAQMGATEFVAVLLISNAVQNAMNGGDNSLLGGLILASVLIFTSWFISLVTYRSQKMQAIFEGTPTLLIHKGEILEKNLAKERVSLSELKTLMRKEGVHKIREVQTAILESDGTLSITRFPEAAVGKTAPE